MKKYVSKFMYNILRKSITNNRFLKDVQKTEHVNSAWFGIPHAAHWKLFLKCNFFSQECTKSYRRITFFTKKSEICIFYAL